MNDTPQGDGNETSLKECNTSFKFKIRMNDTPQGDNIITMIKK